MSERSTPAAATGISIARGGGPAEDVSPVGPARARPRPLSVDELFAGVRAGDRAVLGRALTLIESSRAGDEAPAQTLLGRLLPHAGGAIRVGITGVPGAGKSTFIERLGLQLCEAGRRVAVLAVDPSSALSGGSILGDRTRMSRLSAHERAFIRPSPSGTTLGGVARRTRESMLVCEAAGYDVLLVETVGVGQSETAVADMTDVFLALAIPGAGDELQGVKRGLLERVDVVAVNKAEGEHLTRARLAASQLAAALHVLRSGEDAEPAPAVLTCSALAGEGIGEVWSAVETVAARRRAAGTLALRRREQSVAWLRELVHERLLALVSGSAAARGALEHAERSVREGTVTPGVGARAVVDALLADLRSHEQSSSGARR